MGYFKNRYPNAHGYSLPTFKYNPTPPPQVSSMDRQHSIAGWNKQLTDIENNIKGATLAAKLKHIGIDTLPSTKSSVQSSDTEGYFKEMVDYFRALVSSSQKTETNTKQLLDRTMGAPPTSNGHLETLDQILNIYPTWGVTN